MFNLHFGRQLRANPIVSLPDENPLKKHEGISQIFVQDVHWELFQNGKWLISDESDSSIGGTLMSGLNALVGRRMTHFFVDQHCNLVLYFDGHLLMRIFSLRKSLKLDTEIPIYSLVMKNERVHVK